MVIFAQHTRQQIDHLVERPTHGILLGGPEGSGKAYAARFIGSKLLKIPVDNLENHPYFRIIVPEKGSIGIDQIREIQKFLLLRTPGNEDIRRVAIIENAHQMTTEAQNALLKSLEEPPADTVIIMTAPISRNIKDTIYSRVQRVTVLPVSKNQAHEHFGSKYSKEAVDKAWLLSGGMVGLMQALLDDEEHQLAQEIKTAKSLLAASRYERLSRVEELSKQKESLPLFLQACKLICSTALHQSAEKQTTVHAKRWHSALRAVHEAEAALPSSPNTKLLLTDLMLEL